MRKLLLLAGIAVVLLNSCRRAEVPTADFTVDYSLVQPYEIIQFNNISDNALYSRWNFGDGITSEAFSPTHYYDEEGLYTVTLTVESVDGIIDEASITIEVVYTRLEIEVAQYNTSETIQLIVPYAGVWVYDNLDDWLYDDGNNAILSGESDDRALITFAGLDSRRYYIYVEKADGGVILYDNYQFYEDGWIDYYRTYTLRPFKTNLWTAWVDRVYFGSTEKPEGPLLDKTGIRTHRVHKNFTNKIKDNNSPLIILDVSK